MSATVLYVSMSLDGFIAGPMRDRATGSATAGTACTSGPRRPADADRTAISGRLAGVNRQVVDEFMATGAVVAGRGTFEPAGGWGGDHNDRASS